MHAGLPALSLLPEAPPPDAVGENGLLGAEGIAQMIAQGGIRAEGGVEASQIQPASLDVRLGHVAHRLRAGFLPGPRAKVAAKADTLSLHRIPLDEGAVLEAGGTYLVELKERLTLPRGISALASPKSSTGRIDVFARLVADYGRHFDAVPAGYAGPVYLELSPRSFGLIVRSGTRLAQLRFREGKPAYDNYRLGALHRREPLVGGAPGGWASERDAPPIHRGLVLSVDLDGGIVGYRARRHAPLIDVDKAGVLSADDFWESVPASSDRRLILDPEAFYILASRETVRIPQTHAAEMTPFDAALGEFRVHYAGFFDPGFGGRVVLELRSRDVPFVLEHGQSIGRLVFERLTKPATRGYGADGRASYAGQGLALSKHFKG